ncbi:MAG TPA: cyclase family protein, partial [Bryobacteraceae bacterium]|nr:cyclase family protein [Bryobacteraceae bacterium]
MSGEWIDVSVALKNRMAHWPGDRPFKRKQTSWIDAGDSCNLSEISGSVHTGTHMDAPGHFLKDRREGIDTMPLDAGIGVARVIAIRD